MASTIDRAPRPIYPTKPSPKGTEDLRLKIKSPIFVIGCGRSGTTVFSKLLGEHPQIVRTTGYPDGEDHDGWMYHGQCRMSGLGSPQTDRGHTGFDYNLFMDKDDVNPEIRNQMLRYYYFQILQCNARFSGDTPRRIMNKNPHLSNKLGYIKGLFPDAKFIHVIRDCLPMVASWKDILDNFHRQQVFYWPDHPQAGPWFLHAPLQGDRQQMFRHEDRFYPGGGLHRIAEYWTTTNQLILKQAKNFPNDLVTVKYEDFCSQTKLTMGKVVDFAGLLKVEGWPENMETHHNEKYKQQLTVEQIERLLQIAEPVRQQFGYIQ